MVDFKCEVQRPKRQRRELK